MCSLLPLMYLSWKQSHLSCSLNSQCGGKKQSPLSHRRPRLWCSTSSRGDLCPGFVTCLCSPSHLQVLFSP